MSAPSHASEARQLSPAVVIALWAALAVVTLLLRGPAFVSVLLPGGNAYQDFVQEWLSARSFRVGESVYLRQREAMLLHTGLDVPEFDAELPWNAHPPVAILVALPFGFFDDYHTAHRAWNLVTLPMFLLAGWLVLRELRVRVRWWYVFPAVIVLCWCEPILNQLFQGQLNFPLLLLIVVGWVADRREYQALAGLAVGAAVAMKLFPGLLLVYFLAARRWRAAAFTVLGAAALDLVALAAFGVEAFTIYVRDVIPSLNIFRGAWANVSLPAYWRRVCPSAGVRWLGPPLGLVCQLAVFAVVVRAAWRAATVAERDRAYSLAILGMLLASPVAWEHYTILLTLPFLLLWVRLSSPAARAALLGIIVVLSFPIRKYPVWAMGEEAAYKLGNHLPTPEDLGLALGALGVMTYALTALFVLTAAARLDREPG